MLSMGTALQEKRYVVSVWVAVKELELSYHNGYIGFRVTIMGSCSK